MNITSDYYRTREGGPELECGLAERWIRSVRQAAERAMVSSPENEAVKPLRPSPRTLQRMERRFKH